MVRRSAVVFMAWAMLVTPAFAGPAGSCPTPGQWQVPGRDGFADPVAVVAQAAERSVVLLGERHDSAADHRWQLQMAAALAGRRRPLALGFEMFPREAQPVLDAWVRGDLAEPDFLKAVRWAEVWGYPAEFYLPLFRFARDNHIAMVALNVDRELVRRVGRDGWASVPEDARSGIGEPAAIDPAYRRSLAEVYAMKHAASGAATTAPAAAGGTGAGLDETAIAAALAEPGFVNFADAQRLWDRAMAEAAAAAHRRPGSPLVVVIVGRGHAENGWGIPRQLADLGIDNVGVLLTSTTAASGCAPPPPPGLADAVFVTAAEVPGEPPMRPRLGVMIERGDGGVRIIDVAGGSIAEATGLRQGDAIVAAAGRRVSEAAELVAAVEAMAPGTWLPLQVRRDGRVHEFVARFPSGPDGRP